MAERERPQGRHWLSSGFSDLAARIAAKTDPDECDFDVLIVGSGYGGSIAAHHLAGLERDGRPLRVGVLERGKEYVEGEFPAEAGDLPPHTRFTTATGSAPTGMLDGLFDFRIGPDVSALVGSGVGGGSLINAGVMIRPLPEVFSLDWPTPLRGGALDAAFEECETLLGAAPLAQLPPKFDALNAMSGNRATPALVTIATSADERFSACNYCGNCATGCNFGAKRSLDAQLLADARAVNDRVEIFTGAAILEVESGRDQWIAQVAHTSAGLKRRCPGTTSVRARWLILAAGTFGSTEILKRSGIRVSDRLGHRFSTNGDMLAVSHGQLTRAHALADGAGPRSAGCGTGPTITGVFDDRQRSGFLLEEMNVPWAIRAVFEEVFTTSAMLAGLAKPDLRTHRAGPVEQDPFAVDPEAMEHTSAWALMGLDSGDGELVLPDEAEEIEGMLGIRWEQCGDDGLYARQMRFLESLATESGEGGTVIANPAWRPLPASMQWIAGGTGPLFTVHPLGGCPMGESGADGVVDDRGRVFIGESDRTHEGLVVLDGSIIPAPLGANPALTISAVSLRAIRSLAIIWGLRERTAERSAPPLPPRPRYREVEDLALQPTEIELRERMSGAIDIAGPGECVVELTLVSSPLSVTTLSRDVDKQIDISPESRVRIFERSRYDELMLADPVDSLEARLDDLAIASASVEGCLQVFPRVRSVGAARTWRSFRAWLVNRGLRDIWQWREDRERGAPRQTLVARLKRALALASHAGEARSIDYALRVVTPESGQLLISGQEITGQKIVTYGRASNPLKQLMTLHLDQFPGMAGTTSLLRLDTRYLARTGIPLFRIVRQRDTPSAMLDLVGLGAYLMRMLFSIHVWTLRKPDTMTRPPMRRLPGRLPNVPVFEQYPVPDPAGGNEPLMAVLTRYARPGARPVMMIHGYSASGTTFAHESLKPSAAEYLWRNGRDVWVLDLRTSPGLATATLPWTFEEVAEGDIPAAVEHVSRVTGDRPVDIVAHCMGAAMLSMTILTDDTAGRSLHDSTRQRIGRIVLTQVGPGVVFSPANIFRAYAMTYLKHFLRLERFDFRVNTDSAPAETLLDRVLNLLPYPDEEFYLENPWQPWRRAEFVSIRHRMDLLYGRDFSLANVSDGFLENIDAMFGPLNLDTVSQAMLFTRWKNVTDRQGRNRYYHRPRIRRHWHFPTLSLHGRDNGLASVETLARNEQVLSDAGVDYETLALKGFGHQDIWVSNRSEAEVFPRILSFLEQPREDLSPRTQLKPLVGRPPYLGPILTGAQANGSMSIKLGTSPNLSWPESIVVVELDEALNPVRPLRYETVSAFDVDDNGMMSIELVLEGAGLVLMLYDEHPALLDATFGDGVEYPLSGREYNEGDEARIVDAIKLSLELPGELLETGVVEAPSAVSADRVTLAFGSCQFPAGLLDGEIAYDAWKGLLARINLGEAPDALLLLGDQVYVDPTGGLFDPARLADRYRIPYERWLSADPVQRVLGRIPTAMMLDDHELENDWEPAGDPERDVALAAGERAFVSYQFDGARHRDPHKFWGEPNAAPVPVFMLNSRTDRQARDGQGESRLFSEQQLSHCEAWLVNAPRDVPKVITSASLPLPRHYPPVGGEHHSEVLDGWDGYPGSIRRLLTFIARERIDNVVFLSGDEHLPIAATATLWQGGSEAGKIVSLHAAALYAPIPFANARPEDFVLHDEFEVAPDIRCHVSAETFSPDFGFSYVTFTRSASGWVAHVCFEGSGETIDLLLT